MIETEEQCEICLVRVYSDSDESFSLADAGWEKVHITVSKFVTTTRKIRGSKTSESLKTKPLVYRGGWICPDCIRRYLPRRKR